MRLHRLRSLDHSVRGRLKRSDEKPPATQGFVLSKVQYIEQLLGTHLPTVSGRAGEEKLADPRPDE